MNDGQPEAEVHRRIEAVSRATSELVSALREADPPGMLRALERRGRAIEELREPLAELRRSGSADAGLLAAEKQRLDREADGAIGELREMLLRIRGAIDKVARDGTAVRSYSDRSSGAAVLDRSG